MPRNFGRYRVIRLLGKGGMGTVFLADDTQLERQVALKVPQFSADDGEEVLERFYREARAAATLNHPNLCPVYDVGEIDGIHYLTMAYIDGRPLSDSLRPGQPMSVDIAVSTVCKLARAMAEAHEKGIVHRDLKPSNIFVNQRGEPVVMDFGLARRNDSQDARLTKTGAVLGTPAYMSPEQIKGEVDAIGPCCDIYSLGVILYELLTGELPFDGPIVSVLGQVLTQEPLPPSSIRTDLDPRLEAVCLKMMAKNCDDRYGSMNEVTAALETAIKKSSSVGKPVQPAVSPVGGKSGTALQEFPEVLDDGESVYQIQGKPSVARKRRRADVAGSSAKSVRRRLESLPIWSDPRNRALALAVIAAVLFIPISIVTYQFFSGSHDPDGGDGAIGQADGNSSESNGGTTAEPKEITDSIGMKLVLIPAGEFSMGASVSQYSFDDERPQHTVRITKAFYMGVHEVTQQQYQVIMETNPAYFFGDNRPVESVSWDEAQEFCRRLSLKEGHTYRLPTEAEWEYACRAESETEWHFGDKSARLSDYAWSSVNSGGSTHDVGLLKANRFGLFDVYGNVSEWCQDWFGFTYYAKSSTLNPKGPDGQDASKLGNMKVVRGGSYDSTKATCRSAYRGTATRSMTIRNPKQTGIRVVRVVGTNDSE
jgi:formylglycine-generating enzyme required for sulfatase activity/predicted Ser/Thr protein kinase